MLIRFVLSDLFALGGLFSNICSTIPIFSLVHSFSPSLFFSFFWIVGWLLWHCYNLFATDTITESFVKVACVRLLCKLFGFTTEMLQFFVHFNWDGWSVLLQHDVPVFLFPPRSKNYCRANICEKWNWTYGYMNHSLMPNFCECKFTKVVNCFREIQPL